MIKKEDIVGQEELVAILDKMVSDNTVPHFIMFNGKYGMGKRFFTRYLAEQMGATIYESTTPKNTMEYVREVIAQAYSIQTPTIYMFTDVYRFKEHIANALLKITEEPPTNAYFVFTCVAANRIPRALRSRCFEYRIKPYSYTQLEEVGIKLGCNDKFLSSVLMSCKSPGMIKNQVQSAQTTQGLNEFVEKVVDNIGTASDANVFKIAEKLSFNDEETGYNLNSFFTTFNAECMQRTKNIATRNRTMYFRYVKTTNEYRDNLMVFGINKRNIFDTWVLAIREIYKKYN